MLAIGRCLMSNPSFIMFDEPSLGLASLPVEFIFAAIFEPKKSSVTILRSSKTSRNRLQSPSLQPCWKTARSPSRARRPTSRMTKQYVRPISAYSGDEYDARATRRDRPGTGFAGLTAACALAQRGWSVRVHERGDRLRTAGAGIYIYENGLRVLEAVGAYEAAVKEASLAHTREIRDGRNRLISVHRWSGSRVFSVVRQNVIHALAAAATRAGVDIITSSQSQRVRPPTDSLC